MRYCAIYPATFFTSATESLFICNRWCRFGVWFSDIAACRACSVVAPCLLATAATATIVSSFSFFSFRFARRLVFFSSLHNSFARKTPSLFNLYRSLRLAFRSGFLLLSSMGRPPRYIAKSRFVTSVSLFGSDGGDGDVFGYTSSTIPSLLTICRLCLGVILAVTAFRCPLPD